MPNPKPRPALKTYEEMFEVTDGIGNIIAQYGNEDRVDMPDVEALDAIVDIANYELDALSDLHNWHSRFGLLEIDEVALYYSSRGTLDMAVRQMVRDSDFTHFNGATDKVRTGPLDTLYEVDYEFFSVQNRKYRIEAMALRDGFSPLHEAWDRGRRPLAVHTSFKVKDMEAYSAIIHDLDTTLSSNRYALGQACLSAYGRFSYWRKYSDVADNQNDKPWLKPRVNLRDGI